MRTPRKRPAPLAGAIVAVLLTVTACTAPSSDDAAPDDATAPAPGTSEPVPSESISPSRQPTDVPSVLPTTPSDTGIKLRLVGVVVTTAGDHVVLRADDGVEWALTGDAVASLEDDERVQATGTSRPDRDLDGYPVVVVERVDVDP
jgi:hypothetical protein